MEDIIEEQLRREMMLGSGPKFRYLDDWDMALLRDHLPMVHVLACIIPKLRQG